MKKILVVLFVLMVSVANAQVPSGLCIYQGPDGNYVNGQGTSEGMAKVQNYDALGRVKSPRRFAGNIATDSVKLLSQMASFTTPCLIRIQFKNTVYEDIATTSAETVLNGIRLSSYDTIFINPETSSYDEGFIASSSVASYIGLIYDLVP